MPWNMAEFVVWNMACLSFYDGDLKKTKPHIVYITRMKVDDRTGLNYNVALS